MSVSQYSIKDLENFTGIKAHTIRIWEQRYKLLSPNRSKSNIRYYDEGDLKKIMNVNLIYLSGLKISKIATLSNQDIIRYTKGLINQKIDDLNHNLIDELIVHILSFKDDKILDLLHAKINEIGLIELYKSIILKLLLKLGELWQVDTIKIIHEHYFSKIFKDLLVIKINLLEKPLENGKSVVLFLNEHEEHEFSLLIYNYVLRKKGYTVYYFGQKIPLDEIDLVIDTIQPDLLVTTFTSKLSKMRYEKILNHLALMSQRTKVIISGFQIDYQDYPIPKELTKINTIEELYDEIHFQLQG
jgi:DNA-binding transcriptional MerR regulator